MKAIFLCEKTDSIIKVYDKNTVGELSRLTEIGEKIYTKEDVLREPSMFADVEFIFSTWGMPVFTEEEIRAIALAIQSGKTSEVNPPESAMMSVKLVEIMKISAERRGENIKINF